MTTSNPKTPFAASPLITPERLMAEPALIEDARPEWASLVALADPEAPLADSKAVVHILSGALASRPSPDHPGSAAGALPQMPTLSLAILYEGTRYGGTCAVNSNKKRAAHPKAARWSLKLLPFQAHKDATQVGRILVDAGPHEAVNFSEDPRDLDPAVLCLTGAGKPTKYARATVLRHAEVAARAAGLSEADLAAYLGNLAALFALHDDLLMVGGH